MLRKNDLIKIAARYHSVNSYSLLTQSVRHQSNKHYGESFGHKNVNKEERQGMVNEVFSNVAEKYDIMNDVMSFGGHRFWKDYFVARVKHSFRIKMVEGGRNSGSQRRLDT